MMTLPPNTNPLEAIPILQARIAELETERAIIIGQSEALERAIASLRDDNERLRAIVKHFQKL